MEYTNEDLISVIIIAIVFFAFVAGFMKGGQR